MIPWGFPSTQADARAHQIGESMCVCVHAYFRPVWFVRYARLLLNVDDAAAADVDVDVDDRRAASLFPDGLQLILAECVCVCISSISIRPPLLYSHLHLRLANI